MQMENVVITVVLIWLPALVGHWLWEAYIIATRGIDRLPECRRWWCPEGMKNLVKRGS